MLYNTSMRQKLVSVDWFFLKASTLPYSLNDILVEGFIIHDGCYLSKKLASYCKNCSIDYFEDSISFECFVNSFHMDDYVNEKYIEYSILFCNELLTKWNEFSEKPLNMMISLDDETSLPTIKFYLKRDNASWLDEENIESIIQPVLITNNNISMKSVNI